VHLILEIILNGYIIKARENAEVECLLSMSTIRYPVFSLVTSQQIY